MNYAQLYTSAKKTIVESLISLWVPAQSDIQKYLHRLLTDEEPLITEPVFQSIFPWESSNNTFAEHSSKLRLLDESFVNALSNDSICNEYSFPKDRYPYKHQTACWQGMLSNKPKTMVVTSGTGSGKTECFMIPVLQDIMRHNEKNAVQAIFLYPLNALMKSQQQRMDAWCRAIPGEITYAIYNGDTEERIPQPKVENYYPQLYSRQQIRETPPQILFTNPTMLNYMLVRKEDKPILEQSKGKLRWILLDEAHSYTGSAAAELALQLRRVIDAFGVTLDQVNFAITSATVGDSKDPNAQEKLRSFVAQLTGKLKDDIVIIGGNRIIPQLDHNVAKQKIDDINNEFGTKISIKDIIKVRNSLNNASVLTLNNIISQLIPSKKQLSTEISLSIIDRLGDVCENLCGSSQHSALLPTRAHFFIRAINGVYVCPNHDCERHKDFRIDIGNLTTKQSLVCPSCKSMMLEVTTCHSCGGLILYGEDSISGGYRMRQHIVNLDDDLFGSQENASLEDEIEDSSNVNIPKNRDSWVPIYLAKPTKTCLRVNTHSDSFEFDCKNNSLIPLDNNPDSSYKTLMNDGVPLCPHCGNLVDNVHHLRASANLMGRIITPLLLDNAEPTNTKDVDVVYEGRKFISFTDSRQGTAKSALSINQEVERNWTRSAIFHRLADIRLDGMSNRCTLTDEEVQKLEAYRMLGENLPPILLAEKKALEQKEKGIIITPATSPIKWTDIRDNLENDTNFKRLYQHLKDTRVTDDRTDIPYIQPYDYLASRFLDEFGWIPKRANSLENMGLVHLSYPALKQASCPMSLLREGLKNDDWRDFLKICLDYVIRGGRHYTIASNYNEYLSQNRITLPIYPSKCDLRKDGRPVSKWPSLQEKKNHTIRDSQHRIILLLCAALGISDAESISEEQKAIIEDALNKAWNFISQNILTVCDPENKGYILNILGDKVELQLFDYGWLCPVDSVIVDTIFKGYSPRMTGFISSHTFERYKVREKIDIPLYPYRSDNICSSDIDKWIEDKLIKHQELGIINTPLKNVYYNRPIYIAAEHSAQQDRSDLERYEKKFTAGKLNILSCSTTMEMGVDIGGVSEVVMNNVPPKSANYLQRAGRAGRRNETKTLALTFCPTTPIGLNTWHNPTWPMTHLTEMPLIKMESRQLIQRHVNAFFFTSFINSNDAGMKITERLVDFFGEEKDTYNRFLDYLSDMSNGKNLSTHLISSYSNLVYSTGMQHMSIESAAFNSKIEINQVKLIYTKRLDALNKVVEDAKHESSKRSVQGFVERQRDNFLHQNLLSYLAEHNFLPSAGIPTGLVECSLNDDDKKSPTMHLSQAISAYAPGTQVIKNEWCYEPAGIKLKTKYDVKATRYALQHCNRCGYSTIVSGTHLRDCPKCGALDSMRGGDLGATLGKPFTEIVEPAGFSTGFGSKRNRIIKSSDSFNFIQPVLLEMEDWPARNTKPKILMRTSTAQSEILFYNSGEAGLGYAFCPYCGRMESEKMHNSTPLLNHKHLNTGVACEGGKDDGNRIRRNVLLIGRYQTDFVEIKFFDKHNRPITDTSTLYSLGVILSRKLIEVLGIEDGEVDFGYNKAHDSIFIYDTALGGAGYSPLLREYKDEVLQLAYKSLSECNCELACTRCLIDRRSQWYLNSLDRNKALEWLEMEKDSRTIPEHIARIVPHAKTITTDFNSEFYQIVRQRELKSVKFFISNDVENWNPDKFTFKRTIRELNLDNVDTTFVMSEEININAMAADAIASIISPLSTTPIEIGSIPLGEGVYPIMLIVFTSGRSMLYFTDNANISYNHNWGDGNIYAIEYNAICHFRRTDIMDFINQIASYSNDVMFESRIKDNSSSWKLIEKLIETNTDAWNKISKHISDKDVTISYADRYLVTPLGCILLAQMIKQLKTKFCLNIVELECALVPPRLNYATNTDIELDMNFINEEERNQFLSKCIKDIVGIEPNIIKPQYAQHDRCLSINTEDRQLCIRPDGGVAHGWTIYGREKLQISDVYDNLNKDIYLYNKERRNGCDGILYTIALK